MSFLCCKRKNDILKVIEYHNDGKYWVQKEQLNNGSYSYSMLQWVFYADGSTESFSSSEENKKGSPSILNMECSGKGKWSFNEKDSTFKICDVCIFKVNKVKQDTIFMTGKGYKGNFILVKQK